MAEKDLENSLNADYKANLKSFLNERNEYLKEVSQFPIVQIWFCKIQYMYTDGIYVKGILNSFKTPEEDTVLSFLNDELLYSNAYKRAKHRDYFPITKQNYITDILVIERIKYLGNANEGIDENRNNVIYEDKHNILNKIKKNKPKNNTNNLSLFENE